MPPASSPRSSSAITGSNLDGRAAQVLLADVISYGYAGIIMWATLQLDLTFELWQAGVLLVLFLLLRAMANELRRDLQQARIREVRRVAALRAQAPARWSVEQRDGLGRHVDLGA